MHTLDRPRLRHLTLRPTGATIYVQLRDQLLHAIGAGAARPLGLAALDRWTDDLAKRVLALAFDGRSASNSAQEGLL
jgi:hypothetical protein